MNILYETDKLRIEHEFELTYLTEKRRGKPLLIDDFYGDPCCGLISPNNDWAIIGGDHLTIWRACSKEKNRTVILENDDLKWIHAIRLNSKNIIEILTDPWSNRSAIWSLNINTLEYSKVRDFKDYVDIEYTENIEW